MRMSEKLKLGKEDSRYKSREKRREKKIGKNRNKNENKNKNKFTPITNYFC